MRYFIGFQGVPNEETRLKRAIALLRLADFCGAPGPALAKTGARRQTQLPVSSTGRGRCVCLLRLADFCGAGRGPLAKTGALLRVAVAQICSAGRSPLAYLDGCPCSASLFLPQAAAQLRSQQQLPVSSTGRGRRRCPCSASLHLPQAALRLRSQPQLPVSSTGRGRCVCPAAAPPPPHGGSKTIAAPSAFTPHGGAGGGSFAAQPGGFILPPSRPLAVSPCRCATSPSGGRAGNFSFFYRHCRS